MDRVLLTRAVAYLLGVTASSVTFRLVPDDDVVSTVDGQRVDVQTGESSPARVLVKRCSLAERTVLGLLEGADPVPAAYVEDTSTDEVLDVVMLDPRKSLLGVDARSTQLTADALSRVHARFLGGDAELAALPALTEKYVQGTVVSGCWADAWATAVLEERFRDEFGAWVGPVEASAARLSDDLLAFSARLHLNTLVHADIHRDRIFEDGKRAIITDWGHAHRAPLFLDLGDAFDTVESAWVYREALAVRGVVFCDDVFDRGHLLGRRFAGIRNLKFWLQLWLAAPTLSNRNGLQRVLGMAAGPTNELP